MDNMERSAFTAIVAFVLAPVLAHGLWRPLIHVFGPTGTASLITGAALAIGGVVVVVNALRPARLLVSLLAAGATVAVGATYGLSLGAPGFVTLLAVAAAMAVLVRWLPGRLPAALDGLGRRHKALAALYVVLSVFVVVRTAHLSVFMGDPTRVDRQVVPGEKFIETHSCLSAYVHAAALARRGVTNLYDERWWDGADAFSPAAAGGEAPYRPFRLDYYAYPPPFLLVMAPLAPLEGDFAAQRALWFGLNGLLLALGLWVVARWVAEPNAHRVLLLAPFLFGSLTVLGTLQVGNFQIAVVVISVLAMVAFDGDQPVIGGALLALAILSKLSPGVLGVVLLAERRYRAAAWTAGFGLLYLALSAFTIGVEPLRSFLSYTLPRINSGEAFAFMDDTTFSKLINMAPFGLPFKLQLLGLDVGDPWALGRRIGHAYSVVLIILAIVAVRRSGDRRARAMVWMSLLVLAALHSPFAPAYATIGLLWALSLLAVEVRGRGGAVALVLLFVGLTVPLLVPDVRLQALSSLLEFALTLGVPLWLILRRARRPLPETA